MQELSLSLFLKYLDHILYICEVSVNKEYTMMFVVIVEIIVIVEVTETFICVTLLENALFILDIACG